MKTNRAHALSPLAAALMLAGCFGGGGDDNGGGTMTPPADANAVPASALASSTAYTQFVLTLSGTASESSEPLSAGNVDVPPSSETDEPATVG